jgi:hypothetical protein
MKAKVFALSVAILGASMALGQTAALIGLQQEPYYEHEKWIPTSYRTLLVTFRDGKARLAADVPALIVPRKDGFWRLGVLQKGNDDESIYAIPALSKPPVPSPAASRDRGDLDSDCELSSAETIEFVNPEIVSVEDQEESSCGMHPSHTLLYGTYRIDDLKTALEITTVLGAAAGVAQTRSAPEPDPGDDCGVLDPPDSRNWGIKWSPGKWSVLSVYSTSQACGGDHSYEVKFTPPAPVVGSVSTLAPRTGAAMAKKLSSLQRGSVLTPSGDFLITFGNPIEIFRVDAQPLSAAPVRSIASAENSAFPVMVQWALGKHVIQWEAALNQIGATLAQRGSQASGKP